MTENWKSEYLEYMMAEDFEKAIPLKIDNFPKSFYKFRNLSKRTLENIEQNYIWLADIATLNDPFECSIQIDNNEALRNYFSTDGFKKNFHFISGQNITDKEIKALKTSESPWETYLKICKKRKIPLSLTSEQHLEKVNKRWNVIVRETNEKIRICSFSVSNQSLLLWSHYADQHKGVAIEYDFLDTDKLRTFLQPVIYRQEIEKIDFLEAYNTMKMVGSSLIKSKDWEYEEEWRLTMFKQQEYFPQKMNVPNPKAIYLGTRFNQNDKDLIRELFELAHKRKIPIFQMTKHPNEYKLVAKNTVADQIVKGGFHP
ncbi:DUF2971 domain-containing protein [Leeuwenhoekiella parthenopeia]|uniref:DUF2971 domain-containing protein n=1 Tax=Leeuwenhoekiella parthenopeia TaxID=2890320 RepID=A0ABS8GWZ4_9FLAO|nr:DUF2971 domain-containing protein [Leeuwenhoekiella parthenopeia]MCC4214419.1 DUF2971 domain-containing protein [Leeuwenhoekiella parthenopeia]